MGRKERAELLTHRRFLERLLTLSDGRTALSYKLLPSARDSLVPEWVLADSISDMSSVCLAIDDDYIVDSDIFDDLKRNYVIHLRCFGSNRFLQS